MKNFNKDRILKRCFKSITRLAKRRKILEIEKENNPEYLKILNKEKKLAEFIINIDKYKLFQDLKKEFILINKNNIFKIMKQIKIKEYFVIYIYRNKSLELLEIYYDNKNNLYILKNNFISLTYNETEIKKILLKDSFIKKKLINY